jgi:hypothetical protein
VLEGTTYPEWLVLMDTTGIAVKTAGQVCHPFAGGQDGWVADIRMLVGRQWEPVPTTQGWMPDEEGSYMTCANLPGYGTYALFGYFDGVVAPKSDFDQELCDYENWRIYSWYHGSDYPWPEGYSLEVRLTDGTETHLLGQQVTYEILGSYPIAGFPIPQTGTTTSWDDGAIYATFTDYVYSRLRSPHFVRTVRVTLGECTQDLLWDSDVTFTDIPWSGPFEKPQ